LEKKVAKAKAKTAKLAQKAKGAGTLGIAAAMIDLPRTWGAAKKYGAQKGSKIKRLTGFVEEVTGIQVPRDVRRDLGNQI
jgi:hypothetical protein